MATFPDEIDVLIEVPRGSFIKRSAGRGIEYVSPIPVPFTYGCVPDVLGGDGDPLDAIVLDAAGPAGARVRRKVWGVVGFVDDGLVDDKLICATDRPSPADFRGVTRFFRFYGPARRLLNSMRGRFGPTGLVTVRRFG